jgi:hypothetical protein
LRWGNLAPQDFFVWFLPSLRNAQGKKKAWNFPGFSKTLDSINHFFLEGGGGGGGSLTFRLGFAGGL